MGRSAYFTSHRIDFTEDADRVATLIDGALRDPDERARYRSLARKPLDPKHEAGIRAFKAVARAFGRSFAEPVPIRKVPAELAALYAVYRALLLRAEFGPFLALDPAAIQHRIAVLRYVHAKIHETPELLLIAFENQPPGMLRTRRNRLEDARQAASLFEPWSPDDVRAWVADEPAFIQHLARLAARAKELKNPKARTASPEARPGSVTMPADPDVITSIETDNGDEEPPPSGRQAKKEPVPPSPTPKRKKAPRPADAPDRRKGRAAANAFGTAIPSRAGARSRARPRLDRCG